MQSAIRSPNGIGPGGVRVPFLWHPSLEVHAGRGAVGSTRASDLIVKEGGILEQESTGRAKRHNGKRFQGLKK